MGKKPIGSCSLGLAQHAKDRFSRRLQPPGGGGEPASSPNGVATIGATTDPEPLGIRMLGSTSIKSTSCEGLTVGRSFFAYEVI